MAESEKPEKSRNIINSYEMKTINFQIVVTAQEANSIFNYSNFCAGNVCDMCWGDLSI